MYKYIVMVRVWYPAGPEVVEYTGYEYDRMEEAKWELETAKTERDVLQAWIRERRPA